MDDFQIKLLDQYWIMGSRDPEGDPNDLTSLGKISLHINGQDISGCGDTDTAYGLNQSAIRLLQTIFLDHVPSEKRENPIFYHGCSIICTCPNCIIDYRVQHHCGTVVLDQFYVSGGSKTDSPDRYKHLLANLDNVQYAKEIIQFSQEVLDFLPPTKTANEMDRWELEIYFLLRDELTTLIDLAHTYVDSGIISDVMISRAGKIDVSSAFSVD
jgi:hypothetical protein